MTTQLEPDIYQRSPSVPARPGARRRMREGFAYVALMVLSLVMTVLDKLGAPPVDVVRTAVEDAAAPVLRLATDTIAPLLATGREISEWRTLASERDRLRAENARLKGWRARAETLERQTAALAELTHVVEQSHIGFATARIVSGAGGALVRVALIDAGREQGLKPDYPVMSAQGLVGRVLAAGGRSARLLLLTDFNSRIPVVIGAKAARAVMQGDNSPLPKLAYLQPDSAIKPGDEVFTSGVGGIYPRGLQVGTVVDTGETLRVEPAARLDTLEFVSILLYDTIAATLVDEERAAEVRAGLSRRLQPTWPTSAEGGVAR